MTLLAGQPGPDAPATKPPANTDGEMIEGNITEIDLDNRYILLEDRTGKPFAKIFWSKNKEIFDDKPTRKFTRLKKLKAGFYIAPMVNFEDLSVTGGLKEANLVSLPYKDRPADFPKPLKKGKGNYQPRNERLETLRSLIHLGGNVWCHTPDTIEFKAAMDEILTYAEENVDRVLKAGGGA